MENTNLTFEILMSCMNQKDFSLTDQSNIHSDIVVVNQCDRDEIIEEVKGESHRRMVCSTLRGLSRSRNLAMECAKADIVLFADDDEVFVDDVKKTVLQAFEETGADIIAFDLYNYAKSLKKQVHKLHLFETLKVSSCQIACRRDAIVKNRIMFDVNLGAGTPSGSGEENKFLWDAYKAGLSIYYYPAYIATLNGNESTWFEGFNKAYFFKRGKITSYYMGKVLSLVYAGYFLITKHHLYKQECSFMEAFRSLMKGIRSEKNFGDI